MNAVTKAIMAHFQATPANAYYTALSGRLYNYRAPHGASMPYAVMSYVGAGDLSTCREILGEIEIQFMHFSGKRSSQEAGQLNDLCRNLFNQTQISPALETDGIKAFRLHRINWDPPYKDKKNTEAAWVSVYSFETIIQEV